jgi:hypothetical protein
VVRLDFVYSHTLRRKKNATTIKSAMVGRRPWVDVWNVLAIQRMVEFGRPCWGFGDGSWSRQKVNESLKTASK